MKKHFKKEDHLSNKWCLKNWIPRKTWTLAHTSSFIQKLTIDLNVKSKTLKILGKKKKGENLLHPELGKDYFKIWHQMFNPSEEKWSTGLY